MEHETVFYPWLIRGLTSREPTVMVVENSHPLICLFRCLLHTYKVKLLVCLDMLLLTHTLYHAQITHEP